MNNIAFKKLLKLTVEDIDLQPKQVGGTLFTYCNIGSAFILSCFGSDILWRDNEHAFLANKQIEIIKSSDSFVKVSMNDASALAQENKLVFACQSKKGGHGHICALYPKPSEMSGHWGGYVPIVANVGKENFVKKLSYAWKSVFKNDVKFYLFKGD